METNLIFRRSVSVDGETRVETKIVPVSIPAITAGEGWMLLAHADYVEVVEPVDATPPSETAVQENLEDEPQGTLPTEVTKFISDVHGTAKLVRAKGIIRVVARRGKATFNQTTKNSVCVSQSTATEFFNWCREVYGRSAAKYYFTKDQERAYAFWDKFITEEYARQKARFVAMTQGGTN